MIPAKYYVVPLSLLSWIFLFDSSKVRSQVIPDQSLGGESSLVTPITSQDELISGGAIRGSNLFHSFQEFNIMEGRTAYFDNPPTIQTIFSRVTGQNPSQILGTLGILGSANLFFINPNGIIFGPNASLDIAGSFVASTAHSVVFPDGNHFSAKNPLSAPILTIDVPIPVGLQFEGDASGTIINAGNLATGHHLSFVGSTFISSGQLVTPIGNLAITTTGEGVKTLLELHPNGEIIGHISNTQIAPITSLEVQPGDIVLENQLLVGQNLQLFSANNLILTNTLLQTLISQGNITLSAQGTITLHNSGVFARLFTPDGDLLFLGKAGDILIKAGGNILLESNSQIQSEGLINGNITLDSGNDIILKSSNVLGNSLSNDLQETGADGYISAQSLTLNDGIIGITTDGSVDGGDLNLDIKNSVTLSSIQTGSIIGTTSAPGASGNVGNVHLKTETLKIINDARIVSDTQGFGRGGDITVEASFIEIMGVAINQLDNSAISSTVAPGAYGKGGNINIKTDTLRLISGGQIQTGTRGFGDAGDLTIAAQSVQLLGIGILENPLIDPNTFLTIIATGVTPGANGNGGDITINTDKLLINGGAQVISGSFSYGGAGDIYINTSSLEVIGKSNFNISGLFASSTLEGNGGNIVIKSNNIRVSNEAGIAAETAGAGTAGDIFLTTDILTLDNLGLISTTIGKNSTTTEPGGNIIIKTTQVNLSQSGLLVETKSSFPGGTLTITSNYNNKPVTVNLVQGSAISATSLGTGEAGDIVIDDAESLSLDASRIVGETASNQGGNIRLGLNNLLTLNNASKISTTAGTAEAGGDGGNIYITAGFILANLTENSDITANAFTGKGGNINISTQGIIGLAVRDSLTTLSDITASSQFGLDGNIVINTSDIDPLQTLNELTEQPVDTTINQGCQVKKDTNGRFYNLGRGGIPINPDELLVDSLAVSLMPWTENFSVSFSPDINEYQSDNLFRETKGELILECTKY